MAGEFKLGQFTARSGTGSQSITGVGFEPQALIIWGQLTPGDATAGFRWSNYGIADNALNQWGASATENDTPETTSNVNSALNSQLIYGISYLNSPEMVATLTSMDADGFTLDWIVNAFGTAAAFNYLAIGGSGVTAFVGTVSGPSGAELPFQEVTGVGFRPDVLFGFHTHGIAEDGARESFGWCDGALNQGFSLINSANGLNPTRTRRAQRTGDNTTSSMFAQIDQDAGGGLGILNYMASVSELTADGFVLNWGIYPTTPVSSPIYYLAINGIGAYAGSFDQPTSTGVQEVEVEGTPAVVLFQSVGASTGGFLDSGCRLTRSGMTSSASVSAWCGSENNVSPVSSARAGSITKAIQLYTERATKNAEADFDAFAPQSFSLDWTTVDATAREILYISLRSAPPPVLLSISPDSGPVAGGTSVTLTGERFPTTADDLFVTFDGVQATNVVRVNSTTITCDTPPHAAGPVDVVLGYDGGVVTLGGAFTYLGSFSSDSQLLGARRIPAITINHRLNSGDSSLSFTKDGVVSVGPTVYAEDPFNSKRIFTGPILKSSVTFDGDAPSSVVSHVQCSDKRWFLDKKLPYGKWEERTPVAVVSELLQKFAPDFSYEVESGLDLITLDLARDKPLSAVFAYIAEITGSHYRLDSENDKVIIGPLAGEEVPDVIDDNNMKLKLAPSITKDTDLSQIRTRVYVFGRNASGGDSVQAPVSPPRLTDADHNNYDIIENAGDIEIVNGGSYSVFYQLSAITAGGEAFTLTGAVAKTWVRYWDLTTPTTPFALRFNKIPYIPDIRVTKIALYRTPQAGLPNDFRKVAEVVNDPVAAIQIGPAQFTEIVDTMSETALLATAPAAPKVNSTATVVVMREDLAAQAALAALEGGDGVREFAIFDQSIITIEEAEQRGDAELTLFKNPLVTVNYTTTDEKSRVGSDVVFNLTDPPIVGTFKIQDVTINRIHDTDQEGALYNVTASSQRFTLTDLFHRVLGMAGGGGGGSSLASSGTGASGGPSGWSSMADKLSVARDINGVPFDGTSDITVPPSVYETPVTNGDINSPEIIFDSYGKVVVAQVPNL